MVFGERHHRLVTVRQGGFLDVLPFDSGGIGSGKAAHPQEEELALGQSIKYVRVVIQDGIKRGGVEGTRRHRLSTPCIGASIINMDCRGIGGVAVQNVDSVVELCGVARSVSAIKGSVGDCFVRAGHKVKSLVALTVYQRL